MSEPRALEQVLADWRGDAAVLRARGHANDADQIEAVCRDVATAAEDYITWLNESDAIIKSGLAERTLRRRFRELLDCGLARYNAKREREYRAIAVPPRPAIIEARQRGRSAA